MKRMLLWCACVAVTALACGGVKPPKSPERAVEEPTAETSEAEKPAASEASPAPAESISPAEAKPSCEGLQQSKCKVTVGCAWYDHGQKSKCVDE